VAGKRHVILGAGTAGLNAIRTLRQSGDTDEIVLVSTEAPYSRMVLPYYLERRISESHASTASGRQLAEWGVQARIGRRAAALDTKASKLKLDNGEELPYDDLLIATGSSAVRPRIPGAELARIFNFWTLQDAQGVHRTIRPDAHVVMVGAGFIGFTILNGVLGRAGRLTIVEVAPRILPRMVDEAGARLAEQWLAARGVTLRTGAKLTAIVESGGRLRLSFESGQPLEADLVLMATGIRPNLEWAAGSGLSIEQGILVDERLRSNVPNVYAAGDVAQGRNRISGASEVHAIEPTAMEHGRVAGANMAGRQVRYLGSLLMNIVSAGGLDLASFGGWDDPKAEAIVGHAPERHAYRKYLIRDGRLIGAILIQPNAETWSGNDLGMVKGLVQCAAPLGPWQAHLARHPFEIKKPFLALHATAKLLPETVLGQASPSPAA
jgi:NAD(P)H-nitrite reductase large subunit